GVLEACVRKAARELRRAGEHRRRDVDTEDLAARTDPSRELCRRRTAAAADVDHALAGRDRRALHRELAERAQLVVEEALETDPLRWRGLVPVPDLVGVRSGRVHARHKSASLARS